MVMCVPANCSGVWSQCRRFGSVQSLNKKILPCSLPGGHVRSSKLLGCVVTMQEVLNRAKFEFGFFRCSFSLVVMYVQQVAWVCGHNAGGSEASKV